MTTLVQSSAATMKKHGLLLKSNTLPFSPTFASLPLHSHPSLSSIQLLNHNLHSFHVNLPSSKTPATHSTPPGTDTFDFQEDEDEFEDEDEDIIIPLRNMRQWTRNKPKGFGEGRVYDTSLEDKLLQELEQSRVAQLANINDNLKKDGNPKTSIQKVSDVPNNGIRVRLVNLPKKKNIHRDLQAAFKPFTGIINIIPAVSGNHKTREPVCKGFAFVDFKSHKEANRFVNVFSTQPITFGKVQKQIRCEIIKSNSPNPASVKPSVQSPLPVLNATMAVNSNPVTETPLDPCVEDAAFDMFKIGDDDLASATDDYNENSFEQLDNVVEETHEAEVGSELSLKKQKIVREKTARAKKKVENTPKLTIPGSANRLKMKEKALLSGVFSKYGGKSSD